MFNARKPAPVIAATFAVFAALSGAATGWVGRAHADDQCYHDWSDAAPVVAREQLRTARDVSEDAREQSGSDVVRIMLCRENDAYIYRLVVRRPDGRISNLKVGAAGRPH